MKHRFIQIHTLTSYPASLLNRDDAGFAKRIPFGGTSRTRVSSQCLKRHWRTFEGKNDLRSLDIPMSIRSRLTFDRYIVKPLIEDGLDEKLVHAVTEAMLSEVLGESAKAKKEKKEKSADEEQSAVKTNQITIFGRPEVDFLKEQVRQVVAELDDVKQAKKLTKEHFGKDGKKNLQALRYGAGLDAALFGRMVTSDVLSRVDAAIHVAHAFTVHEEESESDYFSAVDELLAEDDALGAGHINSTELTSGLFYGYVVVDLPQLCSNLEGKNRKEIEAADKVLAAKVVERFIQLVATVSPGAKLGSTAPYANAHMVLVETGDAQPRTLANAFLKPVDGRGDILSKTYESLVKFYSQSEAMYSHGNELRCAAMGPTELLKDGLPFENTCSLAELAEWTAKKIQEA